MAIINIIQPDCSKYSISGTMVRRINSIGLCIIMIVCILLIFASHRMTFLPFASNDLDTVNQFNRILDHRRANNGKYNQIMHGRQTQYGRASSSGNNGAYSGEVTMITTNSAINPPVRIEDVLNEQRQLTLDEMKDLNTRKKR